MAHHAYLYVGAQEQGIRAARAFAAEHLGIKGTDHPDLAVFAYPGLFPIDDARRIQSLASQAPVHGDRKMIVMAAGRLFPPTQNALLKLFEEPSEGTTLVLVVPVEGILLPTLRSRLIALPREKEEIDPAARAFLAASPKERETLVAKLLARAKSDKDQEKQAARIEAVHLVEGLMRSAYAARQKAEGKETDELTYFLHDLDRFMPILHTSSAPLKMIFEHVLLVMPQSLAK